jgi:sporulation protein YlmC with PRC-barrel domain
MFITALPVDHLAVSSLIGETVQISDGETVGEINDLLMSKSGRVIAISIGAGGILGVGGKTVAVPFSALTIVDMAEGKQIRLEGVGKDELLAAPEYEPDSLTALRRFKDRAATLGQSAAGKAAEMSQKAAERTSQLGHKAAEKASALGHRVAEKASDLGHKASESVTEIGHRAVDQVTKLAQKAVTQEKTEETPADPNKADGPSR